MKQTLIASAIASAFLIAAPAMADDAPAAAAPAADAAPAASPLTFNVGVVSDYLFRGVTQTHGDPALQGGADYAFSNGFYVGTWLSTISWVKDWLGKGSVEWDLYGGYRGAFANPDWTYDVGVISYLYPNHGNINPTFLANPNTTEVRAQLGYKWLSVKYSRAVSPYFIGWYGGPAFDQKTRGSNYLEVNASYDLGNGWGVTGHMGHQKVQNLSIADYSDYNVGVTKDVGFGVVGLVYSATTADGSCASFQPYCWGKGGNGDTNTGPTHDFTNVAKDKLLVTFLKTF